MAAMPKHLVPIVATVFVTLFLWLSAVPLLSWYEFSAYHQELDDESFQWHHNGIQNYSFEFDYLGVNAQPIPEPFRIHVRDAKFQAAYQIDTNALVDITGLPNVPGTIEAAFEIISRHLDEHPYQIEIIYDELRHYPSRITVSFSDLSQDNATYYIRRFEVVEVNP